MTFQQSQQKSADERQRRHERSEASAASHGRAAKRRDRHGRHRSDQRPDQQSDAIYSFLASRHETDDGAEQEEEEEAAYVSEYRRVYTRDPLFAHEMAFCGLPSSATASDGRIFGRPLAAIAASTYGRELEFKGAVPVIDEDSSTMIDGQLFNPTERAVWATMGTVPGRRMARPFLTALALPSVLSNTKITAMYVHGEEQPPGMGIVYTSMSPPLPILYVCIFKKSRGLAANKMVFSALQIITGVYSTRSRGNMSWSMKTKSTYRVFPLEPATAEFTLSLSLSSSFLSFSLTD